MEARSRCRSLSRQAGIGMTTQPESEPRAPASGPGVHYMRANVPAPLLSRLGFRRGSGSRPPRGFSRCPHNFSLFRFELWYTDFEFEEVGLLEASQPYRLLSVQLTPSNPQ